MSTAEAESPWLTAEEAARYLKVSAMTLLRWRKLNKGPEYSQRGRVLRYRRDALDKWINGDR